VAMPGRRFVRIGIERPRPPVRTLNLPVVVRRAGLAVALLAIAAVPVVSGTRLIIFTSAAVYALIFLSLALLERTSGQVSLAQLGFAAVGAAAFSHFVSVSGMPWVVAVILSALVAVPVGAIVAMPALRL